MLPAFLRNENFPEKRFEEKVVLCRILLLTSSTVCLHNLVGRIFKTEIQSFQHTI